LDRFASRIGEFAAERSPWSVDSAAKYAGGSGLKSEMLNLKNQDAVSIRGREPLAAVIRGHRKQRLSMGIAVNTR
jgi:hypothetical protein